MGKTFFFIKKMSLSKQNTLGDATSILEILIKEKSYVCEDNFQEKMKLEVGELLSGNRKDEGASYMDIAFINFEPLSAL